MISYTTKSPAGTSRQNSTYTESGYTSFSGGNSTYYSSSYTTDTSGGATLFSTSYATGTATTIFRITTGVTGATTTTFSATATRAATAATYDNFSTSSSSSGIGQALTTTNGSETSTTTSASASASGAGTATELATSSKTASRSSQWTNSTATTSQITYPWTTFFTYTTGNSTSTSYYSYAQTSAANATSRATVSSASTYTTTTQTTFTRSNFASYLTDTVIVPDNDVVWLATSTDTITATDSTTGNLQDIATSYTSITTVHLSDLLSSATYTYLSSSTSFTTASVSTFIGLTVTSVGFGAGISAAAAMQSGHQYFLGQFPVTSYTVSYDNSNQTTTTAGSVSGSASFRSVATLATTTRVSTTVSTLQLTGYSNDAFWGDHFGTTTGIDDDLITRGNRTTTLSTLTTSTTATTRYSEGYPLAISLTSPPNDATATYGRAGATALTSFSSFSQVPTMYWEDGSVSSSHTYFAPTTARGIAPFGTAGNQALVYRNIQAAMGGLDHFYFDLDLIKSVVARAAVGGLMPFDKSFNLSCYSTASGNTDNYSLAATGRFITTASTPFGYQASISIAVSQDFGSTTTTTSGVVSIYLNSATALSGHDTTSAFGGAQAVNGQALSRVAAIGRRKFTEIDSAGNTATGTTFRETHETSTVASTKLHAESITHVFSASVSTGFTTRTGDTNKTTPTLFTGDMAYPAATGIM